MLEKKWAWSLPPSVSYLLPSVSSMMQFFGFVTFAIGVYVFGLYCWNITQQPNSRLARLVTFQPGKPVPWTGLHLVILIGIYIAVLGIAVQFARFLPVSPFETSPLDIQTPFDEREHCDEKEHLAERNLLVADQQKIVEEQQLVKEHAITQLFFLAKDKPYVLGLIFLTVVVIVPIGEEFLFRQLLQRTLEKYVPAFWAISLPIVIFASLHLRNTPDELPDPENLFRSLCAISIAQILFLTLSSLFLFCTTRTSLSDLGFSRTTFSNDVKLGAIAGLLLIPVVLLIRVGAGSLLVQLENSESFADFIALLFFASGLGFIVYRRHQLVSSIILHALLNGLSFIQLLLIV
ncbi:MAG: lysostaphin resistance A-like protein [Thermoguttaceae bacterium]